jgi:hypothetical protein
MAKDDLVCDNLRERFKAKGLSRPQIKSGGRGSSRCRKKCMRLFLSHRTYF